MKVPDSHTDEFILKLLSLDDDRAISILYQQFSSLLLTTAVSIIDNETVAHELVQDLFIVLWEKRHQLNIRPPVKSYLMKAITNKSLNYLRDNKSSQQLFSLDQRSFELLGVQPEVERILDAEDLRRIIQATKRRFPPKTRIVYILSRSFNMSYKEIASYLNISQKSVEKHISKALNYFRKMKNDYLRILLLVIFLMYEIIKVYGFTEVGSILKIVC